MGLLDFIFGKKKIQETANDQESQQSSSSPTAGTGYRRILERRERRKKSWAAIDLRLYELKNSVYNDHKEHEYSENIIVDDSYEAIGHDCFSSYQMSSVKLPHSLKVIGDRAFLGCKNLKKISLPPQVELGDKAFSNSGIQSVIYGGFASSEIGNRVFEECAELDYALICSENFKVTGRGMFYNCIKLNRVTFHEGLEAIEESAFENCIKLKKIVLPQSLKYIGQKAFAYSGLREIYIPDGIEHIEENAFTGCRNLEVLHIPNNYKENIFLDLLSSRHLKEVVCPPNVQIKTRIPNTNGI